MEYLDVVDEDDNVLGRDTRENIHDKGLRHRIAAVLVLNKSGEILLQKRSRKKSKTK